MPDAKDKFVGRSVTRLEDRPLLLGQGRFAADVSFFGQLHMRLVRSTHANARLLSIDTAAARATPGVHAIWTAADVADIPPIDFRLSKIAGLDGYRQRVLASGRVRYVGDPVAAVFADDPYLAEDVADQIALQVEELPALLRADQEPGEFEPGRSTEAGVVRKEYGDVEAAFRNAHATISLELSVGRHSGVPLETRGAIGRYDGARELLELHGAAKVPHWNRDQIAGMLGLSPSRVQLYEGHVGGGFGIRGELYPEDVLVCAAALRFRRPVKWIEDRREHLIAANHSRQQTHRIRAAIDSDGRILAIDDEFFHDQGAYVRTHAATVPDLAAAMLPGPYRVPAYRAIGHIRLTNKTPGGTYRAPGRFESTFVRERLLDAIAARVDIDTVEVRRRNLIAAAEMPYARPIETLGTNVTFDSGDYPALLDKTLAAMSWTDLRADVQRRRSAGEAVGIGVAMFVEKSGLGPFDGARVTVDTSGAVEVVTGAASVGQGVETVIAQICADALGVDYRRIRVVHGQTDQIAYGMGAFASRVTVMTGEAVRLAASKVRAKAIEVAAELLQTAANSLDIVDGQVVRTAAAGVAGAAGAGVAAAGAAGAVAGAVAGVAGAAAVGGAAGAVAAVAGAVAGVAGVGPSIGLGEVARHLSPASKSLGGRAPGLTADGWFHTDHMNYPYGVHAALVQVDRETGAVEVLRYLVAYDIGKAVNPMLVEGQLAGGVAQGLGGALLEEFLYDNRGEPLSVTFADYLMPTLREIPTVDVIISEDAPSPLNPMGLKGAGEGGINAVGAAIAAAIDDAIGVAGAVAELPVTPRRLRDLLRHRDTK